MAESYAAMVGSAVRIVDVGNLEAHIIFDQVVTQLQTLRDRLTEVPEAERGELKVQQADFDTLFAVLQPLHNKVGGAVVFQMVDDFGMA